MKTPSDPSRGAAQRSGKKQRRHYLRERLPAELRLLPNQLTALRVLSIPLLWTLALLHLRVHLGVAVLLVGSTDLLDGFIARRWGQATRFGSRFDALADHLLSASLVLWLLLLRPDFFRAHRVPLVLWATLAVVALGIGWIRFRTVGGLHLYSAKAAGLIGYLFAVHLLLFDSYSEAFFYLALGVGFVGVVETAIVYSTRSRVDEHMGSILFGARGRRRDPPE